MKAIGDDLVVVTVMVFCASAGPAAPARAMAEIAPMAMERVRIVIRDPFSGSFEWL